MLKNGLPKRIVLVLILQKVRTAVSGSWTVCPLTSYAQVTSVCLACRSGHNPCCHVFQFSGTSLRMFVALKFSPLIECAAAPQHFVSWVSGQGVIWFTRNLPCPRDSLLGQMALQDQSSVPTTPHHVDNLRRCKSHISWWWQIRGGPEVTTQLLLEGLRGDWLGQA